MPTVLVVSSLLVTVIANRITVSGGDMCGPETCKARDNCLCASTRPPNNLTVSEMPQFVTLSFDGAVNWGNMPFYRDLLAPRKRKNKRSGCNIGATFFVSHEYVDYPSVHELHHNGHEIALRSISSNFMDFYGNNKAPFPIFLRQGWLQNPERNAGFLKFIDWLLTKDDVFVVTIREVIKFMRNPRPLSKYQEDRCHKEIAPSTKCTRPVQCIYKRVKIVDVIKDRWVRVCTSCPGAYPWVGFRDF